MTAIGKDRRAGFTCRVKACAFGHVARQDGIVVGEINATGEQPDERVDQIAHKRCHDRGEGRADDDTDGHVHDIALGDEVFELLKHC